MRETKLNRITDFQQHRTTKFNNIERRQRDQLKVSTSVGSGLALRSPIRSGVNRSATNRLASFIDKSSRFSKCPIKTRDTRRPQTVAILGRDPKHEAPKRKKDLVPGSIEPGDLLGLDCYFDALPVAVLGNTQIATFKVP